jgi:uncharacterized OB-fold protein
MATALPPGLPNDPLTTFFWEGARKRELHIQRCQSCGTYIHLPRPVCRNCQSFDLRGEKVSGLGTLYSYTETFKPFHPFFVDRSPYILATIALHEQPGLHLLSNLVDVQNADIKIGMPVQVTFEELDTNYVIPVFTAVGS